MRKALVSIVALLAVAAMAQATLTVSTPVLSSAPGGDAGLETYALMVTTDTDVIAGFTAKITGAVNQINPFGMPTILADNNAVILGTGGDPLGDTQFPYMSADVATAPDLAESATGLEGSLAFLGGDASPLAGPTVTVAQVCVADGTSVSFGVTIVLYAGGQQSGVEYIEGVIPIPEPATLALLAIGGVGVLIRRKR